MILNNYSDCSDCSEGAEMLGKNAEQLEIDCSNPSAPPQPIDIELLLQWAIARSGNLPWSRDLDRDLAFDRGLTVRPRKRPTVSWVEAEAMAGIRFEGRAPRARLRPSPDAELVIAAIKRREPKVADTVIACARAKIRPDWIEAEPRLVTKTRRHKKTRVSSLGTVPIGDLPGPRDICRLACCRREHCGRSYRDAKRLENKRLFGTGPALGKGSLVPC
jgi:hypothetical protein